MSIRITIKSIRSGQPRPYADSIQEDHIFLEHVPWNDPNGEFQPWEIKTGYHSDGKIVPLSINAIPNILSQHVPGLRVPLKKDAGMLQPYLTSFGAIEGKPGWYRYTIISPYTD